MAKKIRQQAIKFLGNLNSFITMEDLIEKGMLEEYLDACQYFRETLGSWKMNFDNDEDLSIVGALYNAKPRSITVEEIHGVTGLNQKGLTGRLFNLTARGYISVKQERIQGKMKTLYSLSVFGIEEYSKTMMEKINEVHNDRRRV